MRMVNPVVDDYEFEPNTSDQKKLVDRVKLIFWRNGIDHDTGTSILFELENNDIVFAEVERVSEEYAGE